MMKLGKHYVNSPLGELYDMENTRGADTGFYVCLASDLNACTILDLGCGDGTGLLTCELAADSRCVIGVEMMFAVHRWHR